MLKFQSLKMTSHNWESKFLFNFKKPFQFKIGYRNISRFINNRGLKRHMLHWRMATLLNSAKVYQKVVIAGYYKDPVLKLLFLVKF